LADISIEKFGSDIISMPPQEAHADATTPTSPTKSKRNSLHRRSLSGSNNIALVSAYYKAHRVLDLESLAIGFDAVEQFAQVHEQMSK
jgi:nuclear pore complex protein Nup107